MSAKDTAIEIFNKHIGLATSDPKAFRKTVLNELIERSGGTMSMAAAATHYNTAKKAATPIEGLGRAPLAPGVRKMAGKTAKVTDLVPDEECFTVIELVQGENSKTVGRCQSFIMQGDASEKFDEKVEAWPFVEWVMISGLGPNHGDSFKLGQGEVEIKRYSPQSENTKLVISQKA